MPEVITIEKLERKTVLQLDCGHWIKFEGTVTPPVGQIVVCPKCGK